MQMLDPTDVSVLNKIGVNVLLLVVVAFALIGVATTVI